MLILFFRPVPTPRIPFVIQNVNVQEGRGEVKPIKKLELLLEFARSNENGT